MEWITEQEVKEAAERGLVPALECSYRHWCQICDASEEEFREARRRGLVHNGTNFCALCARHYPCSRGSSCPLFAWDIDGKHRSCADGLWHATNYEYSYGVFQQAARALRDRIFEVLMEHTIKERVKEAPKEEPKKPELRHGDYGVDVGGDPCIVLFSQDAQTMRRAGAKFLYEREIPNQNFEPINPLGNIFVELEKRCAK